MFYKFFGKNKYVNIFAFSAINQVLFFISTLYGARFINHYQTGLLAVILSGTFIVQIFRDFGISSYLQSLNEFDQEHINSAYTFMVITSSTLSFLTLLVSLLIYLCDGQIVYSISLAIFAFSIILSPYPSIANAICQRDNDIRPPIIANFLSCLTYCISVFLFLNLEFNIYSFLLGTLLGSVTTYIIYKLSSPTVVTFQFNKYLSEILKFGCKNIPSTLINTFNNFGNEFIFSFFCTKESIGLFTRSFSFSNLFVTATNYTVSFGAVSNFRKDYAENNNFFNTINNYTCNYFYFLIPFIFYSCIYSSNLVSLLYGDNWIIIANYIFEVSVYVVIFSFYRFDSIAYIVISKQHLELYRGILMLLTKIILLSVIQPKDADVLVDLFLYSIIPYIALSEFFRIKYLKISSLNVLLFYLFNSKISLLIVLLLFCFDFFIKYSFYWSSFLVSLFLTVEFLRRRNEKDSNS